MKNKLFVLFILLGFLSIGGCSTLSESVSIEKRVVQIPIFHPPLPDAILLDNIIWKVLTPEIMEKILQDEKDGIPVSVIFYGLTPKQYEALASNMQELKRYIAAQKAIIEYYRNTNKKTIEENVK